MSSPADRRFSRLVAAAAVVVVVELAALNVAVTARRTTIPIAIDGEVTEMAWRVAKRAGWPGGDNACLVWLDSNQRIEVDPPIYRRIGIGDHLRKDAWSPILYRNGRADRLRLSPDTIGMAMLMPAVIAAALALALPRLSR